MRLPAIYLIRLATPPPFGYLNRLRSCLGQGIEAGNATGNMVGRYYRNGWVGEVSSTDPQGLVSRYMCHASQWAKKNCAWQHWSVHEGTVAPHQCASYWSILWCQSQCQSKSGTWNQLHGRIGRAFVWWWILCQGRRRSPKALSVCDIIEGWCFFTDRRWQICALVVMLEQIPVTWDIGLFRGGLL